MEEEKIKIGNWVEVREDGTYIGYGKVTSIEKVDLKRYPYLVELTSRHRKKPIGQWFDESQLSIIPDEEMFIKILSEDK